MFQYTNYRKNSVVSTHLAHNKSHHILVYSCSRYYEGCHRSDSYLCCMPLFLTNDNCSYRHRTHRVSLRVCSRVPLVPHRCEQELQLVQLSTRQFTALQVGGDLRRRLLRQKNEFVSINKIRIQIVIKVILMLTFFLPARFWMMLSLNSIF